MPPGRPAPLWFPQRLKRTCPAPVAHADCPLTHPLLLSPCLHPRFLLYMPLSWRKGLTGVEQVAAGSAAFQENPCASSPASPSHLGERPEAPGCCSRACASWSLPWEWAFLLLDASSGVKVPHLFSLSFTGTFAFHLSFIALVYSSLLSFLGSFVF